MHLKVCNTKFKVNLASHSISKARMTTSISTGAQKNNGLTTFISVICSMADGHINQRISLKNVTLTKISTLSLMAEKKIQRYGLTDYVSDKVASLKKTTTNTRLY